MGGWTRVAAVPWARASLVMIRHGEPEINGDRPPTRWPLSEAGRKAAAALRPRLAGFSPLAGLTSPEAKASETLALAFGGPVDVAADLEEHRRAGWGFLARDELDRRMHAVFSQPDQSVDGAETAATARSRLAGALARDRRRPLIVCSHGTVISLWLASLLGIQAEPFWRALGFCETFVLDEDRREVARLWA